MAGIVLWHVTMSVDGFIAGPGDAMDWVFKPHFEHPGPSADIQEVIHGVGAILAGRRTYDVTREQGHKVYGGAWRGPIFVLTHFPPYADEDPDVTFVVDDIAGAIATARRAAAGKDVVVLGADTAKQCLYAGLVDEILIHVVPILLGDGIRLFTSTDRRRFKLRKTMAVRSGQVTDLRFRVLRHDQSPAR